MKKSIMIGNIISAVAKNYLDRWKRLFLHFVQWLPSLRSQHLRSKSFFVWWGDLVFYLVDIFFVPDVYEIIVVLLKGDMRRMSKNERELARRYFDEAIDFDVVKVNPEMSERLKKLAHAYVALNTINFKTSIPNAIFIHELVHIWQFQKMGSVYIFRALLAQKSKEGYDYGGLQGLYDGMIKSKRFVDFNFEQQGEIFEDYCRLMENPKAFQSPLIKATYEYYINQVTGNGLTA